MTYTPEFPMDHDPNIEEAEHAVAHRGDGSEVVMKLSLFITDQKTRGKVVEQEDDEKHSKNLEPAKGNRKTEKLLRPRPREGRSGQENLRSKDAGNRFISIKVNMSRQSISLS